MSYAVLPDTAITRLISENIILADTEVPKSCIQPASLDLRLGTQGWRLRASFLPGIRHTVLERASELSWSKFTLDEEMVLEPGAVYLFALQESLRLPGDLRASANPKSTTGRLDVFVRLLANYGDEFDQVPIGYTGPLYVEISPRTFPILVRPGDTLNQLRFRRHDPLGTLGFGMIPPPQVCHVDLTSALSDRIVAWRAKRHTEVIDLRKIGHYDPYDFWEPIYARGNASLILDPNEFYILASQELIQIGNNVSSEMVPIEVAVGEFRVHYAGFFDPGFGEQEGCRAVLEVRSHDVPFVLQHGQRVAKLVYEPLTEAPLEPYGKYIASNYQGQGLKLAKQFASHR